MTLSEQYKSFPVVIRDLIESKFGKDVSLYLTGSIIELANQWHRQILTGQPITKITGRVEK
tara:strand:+ start:311 stop:493 length:183 start_codon:yes stop_codon:yes gene_type:complete